MRIARRSFIRGAAATVAAAQWSLPAIPAAAAAPYRGPNVILVRFGGGVRRAETIQADTTFAPYLTRVLAPRGVLIPQLTIAALDGVNTGHAEGTINLLTGRYRSYRETGKEALTPILEPVEPTLFEQLRKAFDVAPHQALLVNGEDRLQEEFLSYAAHKHFGVRYRSEVLGLYRYKLHKLRRILEGARASEKELKAARDELGKLVDFDWRGSARRQSPAIEAFWDRWREAYGDSGFKNPRGDRLLTELALRALKELRPRIMMINYQDTDYVHWGNASHYTRAIGVIDDGLRQLVAAVDADAEYRDRTVFLVVPDCGRDANPLLSVPYQHHFNSRSAHEIWALAFGPGIARGKVLDKPKDQTGIAATVGALMGFKVEAAEAPALEEIFT